MKLRLEKFRGINNVLVPEKMGADELAAATDVDCGLAGEVRRRDGFAVVDSEPATNLWEAAGGFVLATRAGGALVARRAGVQTVLFPTLGGGRVWFCDLPDGRTVYSNGLLAGTTDGLTVRPFGVPVPPDAGMLTPVAGELLPGRYRYQVTYVRLADGLEGGPAYGGEYTIEEGGVFIDNLPELPGFAMNIYLSGPDGAAAFLAGTTYNCRFSYLGSTTALMLPCPTEDIAEAPVGTVMAFFHTRLLVAVGPVLYASRPNQWETFDIQRDFKQFGADITLLQPVDGGLYVGTTDELAFLGGEQFDALAYRQVLPSGAVLGSGVAVRGELIAQGDGRGSGDAMICIAGGEIVAGFGGGALSRLTHGRYAVGPQVAEVAAAFREVDGVPQYVAIPLGGAGA